MQRYFLKRVLLFVPTIFVVSLIIFFLSKKSETDLIQNRIERTTKVESADILQEWKRIRLERNQLGFNEPQFYWSIYRSSSCDTLNRIADERVRQNLAALSYSIGNWEKVNDFWHQTKQILERSSILEQKVIIEFVKNNFYETKDHLNHEKINQLKDSIQVLRRNATTTNNYLFSVSWNGLNNQYHKWISSLLVGDFGRSFIDGSSVNEKLSTAIQWTLILSSISILLTFIIAIPLAFYSAFHPHSLLSKCLDKLFFAFYALPNFWMATLLIVFFASGDYLNWFPAYGLGYAEDNSSWSEIFFVRAAHLVLPIITLTYGSIAFIYQQLKSSIKQQLKQDYILTAKAKGLSNQNIKWQQLFKNVSFPLITILGSLLPALISGSFIVEYIFSIPGMGKLSVDAFMSRDFGMVYAVLMLSSLLGMLGVLLADLLYYKVDPRVQLHESSPKRS